MRGFTFPWTVLTWITGSLTTSLLTVSIVLTAQAEGETFWPLGILFGGIGAFFSLLNAIFLGEKK